MINTHNTLLHETVVCIGRDLHGESLAQNYGLFLITYLGLFIPYHTIEKLNSAQVSTINACILTAESYCPCSSQGRSSFNKGQHTD